MANPKHIFDFEGILSMDINQQNWKEVKKKLESAFGDLRVGINEGMAEEEAKKFVALFNKVLYKAKLPEIGVEDLIKNFDKVSYSIEKAIGLINNIDISVLKGIETSLDHIAGQVDKIVDKMDDIKPKKGSFNDFNKEAAKAEDNLDGLLKKKEQLEKNAGTKGNASKKSTVSVAPPVDDVEVKIGFTPVVDKEEIEAELKKILKDYKKNVNKILGDANNKDQEGALNNLANDYLKNIFSRFNFNDKFSKDVVKDLLQKIESDLSIPKTGVNKVLKGVVSMNTPEAIEAARKIADEVERKAEAEKKAADEAARGAKYKDGTKQHGGNEVVVGIDANELKNALKDVTWKVQIDGDKRDDGNKNIEAFVKSIYGKNGNLVAQEDTLQEIKGILSNGVSHPTAQPNKDGVANNFVPRELSIKDAEKVVTDKVDKKVLQDWYVNQSHAARDILTKKILADVDLRNAALNIAWDNYKKASGVDISFNDFLKTDISMYRGAKTAQHFEENDATSFTAIEAVAKQFGEDVVSVMMKPIETLGALQRGRESEFFVQRDSVKDRPEVQKWLGDLAVRDQQKFDSRVNEIKALLQQNRSEDDVRATMKNAGWDNIDEILAKAKEEVTLHQENAKAINAEAQELQKLNTVKQEGQHGGASNGSTATVKIALDDSTLEQTLNRVFANIINPTTEQNDWAKDVTLDEVKTVLGNIHTAITQNATEAQKIDIQLNTSDITTAIKEVLYAKEIRAGFTPLTFDDVFEDDTSFEFGSGSDVDVVSKWINKFTREVFIDLEEAQAQFEAKFKGKWKDKFNTINPKEVLSTEEMLDRIVRGLNMGVQNTPEQNDFAQVIVQAIETQGGKIVETIKLLLPQNITEGPNKVNDDKLINAFNVLTQAINDWKAKTGDSPKWYFDEILNGSKPINVNVVNAMETLGMMSGGKPTFKLASVGGINSGVALADELVYHTTPAQQTGDLFELMEKQNRAHALGASIPRIIAAEIQDNIAYQLQTKAPGTNLRRDDGGGFLGATDEQIDKLLYTLEILEKEGLVAEFRGDNIMYDPEKGFSIIDLSSKEISNHNRDSTTADEMLQEIAWHGIDNSRMDGSDLRSFRNRLYDRKAIPVEQRLVNANTIKAEQEAKKQAQQTDSVNVPIMPSIEDGAVAKAVADDAAKFPPTAEITPTFDKGKIQAALDNIGDATLGVNLSTNNIATAVKEALYAKEIQKDFKPADVYDVFERDFFSTEPRWMNKLTGEVVDDLNKAKEAFKIDGKGLWKDQNQPWDDTILTTEEVLDRIVTKLNTDAPDQDKWAQVIVEAINTQGGNIVETIKLILPQNVGDDVDEAKLAQAFETFTSFVAEWSRSTKRMPKDLFQRLENGINISNDPKIQDALRVLGLVSEDGKPTLKVPKAGKLNLGVAIGDKEVVSTQRERNMPNAPEVMARITKAVELGAAVPKMLALHEEQVMSGVRAIFNLQERAIGKNITDYDTDSLKTDTGFLAASTEQIDRLIHTFEVLEKVGLQVDLTGDNILFDKNAGFSMIDFEVGSNSAQQIFDRFINKLQYASSGGHRSEVDQFIQLAKTRFSLPSNQRLVNDVTVAEEMRRQVASKQQQKKQEVSTDVKITPTMEEGAIAKLVRENVEKTPAVVEITPVVGDTKKDIDVSDIMKDLIETGNTMFFEEDQLNEALSKLSSKHPLLNDFSKHVGISLQDLVLDADPFQDGSGINGVEQRLIEFAKNASTAVNGESQSAIDAAQSFVEAANAKKEFVKANQMVKKSAEESEEAVEEEIEAVERSVKTNGNVNDLAKEKQIRDANDNLLRREEVRKAKGDDAIITTTDVFMPDEDGNEQFVMKTIIQDFEAITKEAKKTKNAVDRAQKKLNEFLARFKSKTGGKANLVTGFSELDGQTVTADNMEETFNKMTQLQAEYAKLEQSFRKGQSSLNPFVNAINKSENIANIFGSVEAKFNNLISRSDELTDNFERLRELSEKIKSFSDRMNDPNQAAQITTAEFSDFAKQVGEFNALKTKVEGEIKNEGRNTPNRNKYLKDLESLYMEAEQTRARYEASGSQKELEHIKNISLKIARKKEEIELTAQEIALLKQRSKEAHESTRREILGAQTDKDIKKRIKEEVKSSRDQYRVNRANSVYNSGRNVQDSLGILPEDMDVSGIESVQKLNIALEKMTRLREIVNKQGHIVTKAEGDQLKEYTRDIQQYSVQVKELVANYEKFSDENSASLNATFMGGDVKAQLEAAVQAYENGKAKITAYDEATRTLTYSVKTGKNEFTTYTAGIRDVDGQMRRVTGQTKRMEGFMDSLKRKFGEVFKYFSASSLMYKAINELRKGIQYIREIDAALVELRKVTDETEETYDEFLNTAAKTANRLGSTISAVTEATATFAKLGYSMEMATEMAEAAIIYKNVGDNIASTEDAADSIISTLKGFGLEAAESMRIVDRFNEVGNKFAITSQGLGEALRLSASALNEGGNTLDESIGIITAANEVVNDPSSVGTALKTLTLRLRGSKTELEEMGEDVSDMATTTSQLQSKLLALTGGQVDIMLDANTFKSSTQILREMAAAWEDMTDIQRASALELMGGKRQANVLSALISNFDTAEKAIEASANSAGSALRENEVYLDSIQGRIDLLTNAMQTMWSNALDSDVVKFFVDLLTKLVKLVDKIGLIKTALAGVFIYLTAFKKQNPLNWINSLTQYLSAFKGWDGFKQLLGQLLGVAPAMKIVTAETVANTIATQTNDAVKTKAIMTEMGLSGATGALSIAQKKQAADAIVAAVNTGALSVAQGQAALATLGFSAAVNVADGSIKAVDATTKSFMASNPIGWILAIISVLITVITLLAQIPSKIERLTEKLENLNSEISDIESEIDSLNSELETTQDRMEELLALPHLSFTDQEELKNLQAQAAELERIIKLKNEELKSTEEKKIDTVEDLIAESWNDQGDWYIDAHGVIHEDSGWNGFWHNSEDTKDILDEAFEKYESSYNANQIYNDAQKELENNGKLSDDTYAKLLVGNPNKTADTKDEAIEFRNSWYNGIDDQGVLNDYYEDVVKNADENKVQIDEIGDSIEMVLKKHRQFIKDNNLSYGMSDEIDAYLDEIYSYQLRFNQAQGQYVKSDAISSVFDLSSTKELQAFGKALREIVDGDGTDEEKTAAILENLDAIDGTIGDGINKIDGATDAYNRLFLAMDIVGVTAQDIADYFVLETGAFNSNTMDGIIAQYDLGLKNLKSMQDDESLFDQLFDEDGEVIETKIAEMMKGADETTREEFSKLLKSIKDGAYKTEDGLIDWEKAMESFSISGGLRGVKLAIEQLSAINVDIFPGLEDEIKGIIDTFDELIAAVGNTVDAMDTLEQARAEEAYSGSVSLETLEKLMQSTDNYADLIEVDETGAIKLAAKAQDILVQEKINTIKKNAELALSSAQMQLVEAKHNQQIYTESSPAQEVLRSALAEVGGAAAFVTSLWNDITSGNWDGAWERAKSARNNAVTTKKNEYASQAAQATTSVAEAEKAVADAEKMKKIADGLTPENIKSRYDSEAASGGTKTKEEAEKDLIQEGWEKLINKYENELALITNERDLIEAEIDQMEARGGKASAQYYEDLIRSSNEEKALLEEKKKALEKYLAANAGNIDQDTWTEYNNEINETAVAIKECETNTIEWAEALREIDAHYFEQVTDEISRLGEELDFVNSLLEDEDVADENGNWSSAALTRLGLYTQQMEMAAVEAQRYQDEIDKLNTQYKNGELSEEQYQESLSELVSGQQDAIQSYEDAKDGIVELNEARINAIKDGIDKEIEAYEDLIDLKKEELDAERDLYDFRKNVKKQTKDISSLERRIASLSGSTNAADIATRKKLQAELNEAREGLNDTYYERSREQQSQAFDDESEAFRESKEKYIEQLEQQLEDTEMLIQQSLMDVLLNADSIYEQLAGEEGIAAKYGIQLSDKLTQPWKDASTQAISWKNELQNSMTAGEYAALIGEGGAITAFANGVANKMQGSWNSAQNAVRGYADFLTGSELGNEFRSTITGFGNQIQTIIDKWNGVRTAAEAAYEAQSRQVTVGGVSTGSTGGGNGGGGSSNSSGDSSSGSNNVAALQAVLNTVFSAGLVVDGKMGSATTNALRTAQSKLGIVADGKYGSQTRNAIISYIDRQVASWRKIGGGSQVGQGIQAYLNAKNQLPLQLAKGTMGLDRDKFAITDESWIGEEITLAAGKNGQLQYLKKGSAVLPSELATNLVEWGKLNPNMLNVGGGANINMISNAINKPEINLDIAEFLHVDRVDKDTMPELEKFVDKKMNDLVRQLNYSIKKFK